MAARLAGNGEVLHQSRLSFGEDAEGCGLVGRGPCLAGDLAFPFLGCCRARRPYLISPPLRCGCNTARLVRNSESCTF
jgi:hypothetical protein